MKSSVVYRVYGLMVLWTFVNSIACFGELPSRNQDNANKVVANPNNGTLFTPIPTYQYTSKVKNLIMSLAPTDDELNIVSQDPCQLQNLIKQWLTTSQADAKLIAFFANAFQQTGLVNQDLQDQSGGALAHPKLLPNLSESMARTALWLMKNNQPFTRVYDTNTFMMTPALMSWYVFVDSTRQGQKFQDTMWTTAWPSPAFVAILDQTRSIPFSSTVDPNSPDYLVFNPSHPSRPGCTKWAVSTYLNTSVELMNILNGSVDSNPISVIYGGTNCAESFDPFYSENDFNSWRPVTIVQPGPNEKPDTDFWNIPKYENATTLKLLTPRVGFFTTAAFFANWSTNASNLDRVTTNQSLIVGLGQSINPVNLINPISQDGLNAIHATDPQCSGCHRQLDPAALFFQKSYTLPFGPRSPNDTSFNGTQPALTMGLVSKPGQTMRDFGTIMAQHPYMPGAWVQKLCWYANSTACDTNDPAFISLAQQFSSSFDMYALLVAFFSSPLVTGSASTLTWLQTGDIPSIARRDHLCAALSNRIGIDACNVTPTATIIAQNLPSDSFSRSNANPIMTTNSTLFFRTSVENLCIEIANVVVDQGSQPMFDSTKPFDSIAKLTNKLAGFPSSDPRATAVYNLLQTSYREALQPYTNAAGITQPPASPADALKSTFVIACMLPTITGIGL